MAWSEFYKYLTVMLVLAFITIGLILYAIFKNDYSKRIDIVIKTIVLIDLVIVTIIFLKLWF
jgi:hypothetical protein